MPFANRNHFFKANKDEKTCSNAETNDFDQQMAYVTPARWSKYKTYAASSDPV